MEALDLSQKTEFAVGYYTAAGVPRVLARVVLDSERNAVGYALSPEGRQLIDGELAPSARTKGAFALDGPEDHERLGRLLGIEAPAMRALVEEVLQLDASERTLRVADYAEALSAPRATRVSHFELAGSTHELEHSSLHREAVPVGCVLGLGNEAQILREAAASDGRLLRRREADDTVVDAEVRSATGRAEKEALVARYASARALAAAGVLDTRPEIGEDPRDGRLYLVEDRPGATPFKPARRGGEFLVERAQRRAGALSLAHKPAPGVRPATTEQRAVDCIKALADQRASGPLQGALAVRMLAGRLGASAPVDLRLRVGAGQDARGEVMHVHLGAPVVPDMLHAPDPDAARSNVYRCLPPGAFTLAGCMKSDPLLSEIAEHGSASCVLIERAFDASGRAADAYYEAVQSLEQRGLIAEGTAAQMAPRGADAVQSSPASVSFPGHERTVTATSRPAAEAFAARLRPALSRARGVEADADDADRDRFGLG